MIVSSLFHKRIFFTLILAVTVLVSLPSVSYSQSLRDMVPAYGAVRDVEIDNDGNLYVIALHWTEEFTQLKKYSPDGEEIDEFEMRLPNFCCDPFPLSMVLSDDGFLYVLLPGKKQTVMGVDIQIVKMNLDGEQVDDFGNEGSVSFPPGFRFFDFDVAPDGTIWALNDLLEIYKFDENNVLRKIRELEDVLPDSIHGARLNSFEPQRFFTCGNDCLIIFSRIQVDSSYGSPPAFDAMWEFDTEGKLVNRVEWETPWYSKRKGDDGSFFQPIGKATFIRDDYEYGSMLGFEEGSRYDPDTRKLAIIDWSMRDGFHFYKVLPVKLPKEIYLKYDLSQVRFVRTIDKTILFFPLEREFKLLVVEYGEDGKEVDKFKVDAFR